MDDGHICEEAARAYLNTIWAKGYKPDEEHVEDVAHAFRWFKDVLLELLLETHVIVCRDCFEKLEAKAAKRAPVSAKRRIRNK
jgi:hypothetical protein